ncbi:excisionase family DNA binding protein [Kribbella antiqua]|uniref:Excisionase family DNA binding protein n=1 Tax=Kribbella antiqua TaxID=2512217 RepID=A0A4R2I544_9ACTN|nr:helix-turn-helix domain-containing protein [Kribbella antiqua]TCO37625.1 excisionase family DNA binding protein [Kribbella antiqua]
MTMTLDLDPLWDIDQVSAYLNIPKATLYRWRTIGYGPPARRIGRHLRYRRSDVIDWFAGLQDADDE